MNSKGKKALSVAELQKVKALIASGKTYNAVAVELGRDPKTIKKYATEPETAKEIQELKQELADMYEELAKRFISSITDEDINKINAYQRTIAASAATDKFRLLRNQSNQNISLCAQIMELQKTTADMDIESVDV